jgi:hypothetical protein
MNSHVSRSRWGLFLSLMLLSLLAHGQPALTKGYRVLSFPGDTYWDAIETVLEPTSDGRLHTKNLGPFFKVGNCGDILDGFQARPLAVFRQKKYITQEMYEALIHFQSNGIKPSQLRLIQQFSDLPTHEVHRLLGASVPEERVLDNDGAGSGVVRVSRGTILYVRGFEPKLLGPSKVTYTPLKVPWELDQPLPSKLTRPLDREKLKYLVEIGRLHAEEGPIPGDRRGMVKLALTLLSNEVRGMKISPDDVIWSGHFLDAAHTRLFTAQYPTSRPLTPEIQTALEANRKKALAELTQSPLPRGPQEWAVHENSVVIGRLSDVVKSAPLDVESISDSANRLSQVLSQFNSAGVTGDQAFDFIRDRLNALRQTYDFKFPGVESLKLAPAQKPIQILDFTTPLMLMRDAKDLRKLGVMATAEQALQLVKGLGLDDVKDPGLRRQFQLSTALLEMPLPITWQAGEDFISGILQAINGKLVADPEHPQQKVEFNKDFSSGDSHPSVLIGNIDPAAIQKLPKRYLPALILSVVDLLQKRFEALSHEDRLLLTEAHNLHRREKKLPPVTTFTFDDFLENYGVSVPGVDEWISNEARELGGKSVEGVLFNPNIDFSEFSLVNPRITATAAIKKVYFYLFTKRRIEILRKLHPEYATDAYKNLDIGLRLIEQRIDQSGTL